MSKGTGLVRSNPKPQNLPMSNKDAALLQQMIQQAHTQISKSYFTTNSTTSNYIAVNTPTSYSGAQHGIRVLDHRNNIVFQVTAKGELYFYIDDHKEIVRAIERLWKGQIQATVVTQTEIDALAYAAGIYIKNPKDALALREKAFDRLEELCVFANVHYEEDENPKLLRR